MCIVIGKYFDQHGWVAVKNRDRNYIPEISFRKKYHDGVEILYFWDDITQYCEGINSTGIGVLSASLMVLDDEKEIKQRVRHPSKDGKRIKKALSLTRISDVLDSLINDKLTGNTLVFNQNHMYVLEGAVGPDRDYHYHLKQIPKNSYVVRTNHGISLSWAGYQRGTDAAETMSRISSETRLILAKAVADWAQDPEDLLDGLTLNFTQNSQLNPLRTATDKKKNAYH